MMGTAPPPSTFWGKGRELDRLAQLCHVLRGGALGPLDDVELYLITLGQALKALAGDRGEMDETILSIVGPR